MKEIDENLIYNQFDGCSIEMMKKTFSKLIKRKEKDEKKQSKVREDKFNAAVKELLDLCPQVNMIPVGKSYQYHEDCYDTNDFDEIYGLTYEKFEDKAIPKEYGDMSNNTYKRMLKLWEIACKNSPINYKEYNDGDYCEFCHISLHYFDRNKQKILETPEL